MKKQEVINYLSKEIGMTKKDVTERILPALKGLAYEVATNGGITINNFGKAVVQEKKGRKGTMNGVSYDHSKEVKRTLVVKIPVK